MAKNYKSGKTTKKVQIGNIHGDTSNRIVWREKSHETEWETELELFEEFGDMIPAAVMRDIKTTRKNRRWN